MAWVARGNCRTVAPLIARYNDPDLNEVERVSLSTHLLQCPCCLTRLQEYRALDQQVRRVPKITLAPQAREAVLERGITINGLPIMIHADYFGGYSIRELDIYYEDCVIGGPGAFLVTVEHVDRFAEAIRRKLVLEIAGAPPRIIPAQAFGQRVSRIDCLIGEKLRRRWMDN